MLKYYCHVDVNSGQSEPSRTSPRSFVACRKVGKIKCDFFDGCVGFLVVLWMVARIRTVTGLSSDNGD